MAGTLLVWAFGFMAACGVIVALLVGVALAMAYPQLPDVSELSDYRPKLSMRVYSIEGTQIGEFGEERRNFMPFKDIPKVMKDAVLAIEDARFYQHGGVDYIGLLRASLANLGRAKSQGASTITMQVARNVYLSSEKTFTRKIYEILLTTKLEHNLSKDQIFEIYLNHVEWGEGVFGAEAAAQHYFRKRASELTPLEAARLAVMLPRPRYFEKLPNSGYLAERAAVIAERMPKAQLP